MEINSMNAISIPNIVDSEANLFDFFTSYLAAPLTQGEINSMNASRAETTQRMIDSLGPTPAPMTPEYMIWALQQTVEPLPGVFLPIYMVAAPLSEEEIASINAKKVEFAPRNAMIIIGKLDAETITGQFDAQTFTGQFDAQTITAQFKQHPQQMIEPQWYLSGVQRPDFDFYGNSRESYKCSDGEWRLLEGEDLEKARSRTMNLQAPIPRR